MGALDACNRRFDLGTVLLGSAGFARKRDWSTKFEMRSQRDMTRVEEPPAVMTAEAIHIRHEPVDPFQAGLAAWEVECDHHPDLRSIRPMKAVTPHPSR